MSEILHYSSNMLFWASVFVIASVCLVAWFKSSGKSSASHQVTFGTGDTSQTVSKLPQGWWTDSEQFQLERRAIFSKTWICVSHLGRYVKPGDYVSFEYGNFSFFLVLGKDGVVRAFHNVCRHRAFPVTKKASGTSTVLSCKYHGWSYDTKGQLLNAPQFSDVAGFDKSQNGLFEIRTHFDSRGFIHVNFNGLKEDTFKEPLMVSDVGMPQEMSQKSKLLHSWELKGNFNWKLAANDETQGRENAEKSSSTIFSRGKLLPIFATEKKPLKKLEFFPTTTAYMEPSSPFWYQITYNPDSAKQTTVRCEVYSNAGRTPFKFEGSVKNRLEISLKETINRYEEEYTLMAEGHIELQEHASSQGKILDLVKAHVETERIEGKQIKPATIMQQCKSAAFTQAEQVCQALECASRRDLDW